MPAKGPDDSAENKIENPALTKIQSDEKEIIDFSAVVKSQEILKSEEVDDHSGDVQKARKIKFSPLKNPTSISLVAKEDAVTMEIFSDLSDDDISEENSIMENKIENPALNEQTESVSKKIQEVQLFLEK